jgi:hypothetical protein
MVFWEKAAKKHSYDSPPKTQPNTIKLICDSFIKPPATVSGIPDCIVISGHPAFFHGAPRKLVVFGSALVVFRMEDELDDD